MTQVYAVSEDDVVYFDTMTKCRRWIRDKGFVGVNPPEEWEIYKISEYDSPGDDAYPLEIHQASDYIGYIVDAGKWNKWGAVTIEDARNVAALEIARSRRRADIYRIGDNRKPVESYVYPNMPERTATKSKPKGARR